MTVLGALEKITARDEPPQKVALASVELAQALILRSADATEVLEPEDASTIVNSLAIHLDLFLDRTAKPRSGAKGSVLARRAIQTLRMRHTNYLHHARRIHDAIWREVDRVGHNAIGMSLGHAGKLAQAAAYGVAFKLENSPLPRAIGAWIAGGTGPFDPAWTGLFEIDLQVMAAVAAPIPAAAVEALLDRLSLSPGELLDANPDHLHLDNPIWRKPFVKLGERYFCFSPQSLFSAHDDMLAEVATAVWQKPAENLGDARGDALEALLGQTLEALLPNARVLTSCRWTDPRDGRTYETDAIVLLDGMALIWEAKGSHLSLVARRGSNEWFKTFDDIVVGACVQATRLEKLLRDTSRPDLEFETDQGAVTIDRSDIRHILRFGVSLERLTMASFGLEESLRERIERVSALPMPIVTIGDLWLLQELVANEGARLHYLLRRSEIERDTLIIGDELDLIAWYLRSGFVGLDRASISEETISLYGLSELMRFHLEKTPHYDPRRPMPRRTTHFWDRIIDDKEERRPGLWTDVVYDMLNMPLQSQERFLDDIGRMRRRIRRVKAKGAADAVLMQRRDQAHPAIFACLVTWGLSDTEKIANGRNTFVSLCEEHPNERVLIFHLDAGRDEVRPTLNYYRGTRWDHDGSASPIEGVEVLSDLYI